MYSNSEFRINDYVQICGEIKVYRIIGIQAKTYFSNKVGVSTDYILYLGNRKWVSARKCFKVDKKKNR